MADSVKKVLSAVVSLLAFNEDGTVNWEVSGEVLFSAINAEVEEARKHDAAISAALDSLFDRVPAGTRLPTPMVCQAIAGELSGGDLVKMAELSGMVADYLERSSRFESKRGRSGGLARLCKATPVPVIVSDPTDSE